MSAVKAGNVALAFLLELVALWAVGRWGWQRGGAPVVRVALALGAAGAWATVWGVFLSPRAAVVLPDLAVPAGQLVMFGVAAGALAGTSGTASALGFAAAVVANRLLLALWEQ